MDVFPRWCLIFLSLFPWGVVYTVGGPHVLWFEAGWASPWPGGIGSWARVYSVGGGLPFSHVVVWEPHFLGPLRSSGTPRPL